MQKKGFEYSRNTKGQYSFLGIRPKTQDDYKREEDDRRIDADDLQEFDEDHDNQDNHDEETKAVPPPSVEQRTTVQPPLPPLPPRSVDQSLRKADWTHDRPSPEALEALDALEPRKRKHSE
jgi:hypothetical protein